jgi:hypothetical protein
MGKAKIKFPNLPLLYIGDSADQNGTCPVGKKELFLSVVCLQQKETGSPKKRRD